MSQEELKQVIDQILVDKKGLVISKLHGLQEQLMAQLEELKDLQEFERYDIPAGIQMGGGSDSGGDIDLIHRYTKEISSAVNQLNLINTLLEGVNNFCTRSAFFLLRDDKLVGWKGKGFNNVNGSISDDEVKKVFFSLSADTIFKEVLNTKNPYEGAPNVKSDDHLIFSRFGGDTPAKILVLPFFVKGKPQAIIYTDAFGSSDILKKEIEILATVGEMSLDLLPLKQKILAKVKTQEFVEDPYAQNGAPEPEIKEEPTPIKTDTPPQSMKLNDPERKARVIIEDMVLYNPQAVEDGIKNKNLSQVLGDTIYQAKEEFLRKYDDLSVFEQQLIKILAKGDRSALEGYQFETL